MVQIFLQETSRFASNPWGIVGNRDNPPDMSNIAARLDRAKNNMLEALPFFLTLALVTLIKGDDTTLAIRGATIFLVARVLYVAAYVSGVPILRSLIWLTANAGLVMMALPLI